MQRPAAAWWRACPYGSRLQGRCRCWRLVCRARRCLARGCQQRNHLNTHIWLQALPRAPSSAFKPSQQREFKNAQVPTELAKSSKVASLWLQALSCPAFWGGSVVCAPSVCHLARQQCHRLSLGPMQPSDLLLLHPASMVQDPHRPPSTPDT